MQIRELSSLAPAELIEEIKRLRQEAEVSSAEVVQLSRIITAKDAENARLREALGGAVALATKAHGHWDSDQDMKVGKILLAMAGALPGYDRQADAIHAALAQEQGEPHDNQD